MKYTKTDTAKQFDDPAASIAAFLARGSKPSAGEAKRSGKRGHCEALNEVLPEQQRRETLPKVCAPTFAFSTAHIQRAALHIAQRYTARSIAQRPALHRAACSTVRKVGV